MRALPQSITVRFWLRCLLAAACLPIATRAQEGPVYIQGSGSTPSISTADGVLVLARGFGASLAIFERTKQYPQLEWLQKTAPSIELGGGEASVSTDGVRIAIGASSNDTVSNGAGVVMVLERQGSEWQIARTIYPLVQWAPVGFGRHVAISGEWLVISEPADNGPTHRSWVYRLVAGQWQLDQTLSSKNGFLAISGRRIAIGQPYGSSLGNVWVLDRGAGGWVGQTIAIPGDVLPGDSFGYSVALEGDLLAVGAPGSDVGGASRGAAHVFRLTAGQWTREDVFHSSGAPNNQYLGWSVALRGENLAVGAPSTSSLFPGLVELYQHYGLHPFGGWFHAGTLSAPVQGLGRSMSYDGLVLAVGTDAGASAATYTYPADPSYLCTAKTTSAGCVPTITVTGSLSVSTVSNLHVRASNLGPGIPGLLIWSRRPAAVPFGGGTLCLGAPISRTPVQQSSPGAIPSCLGTFDFHVSPAFLFLAGLAPGDSMFAQYYFRDGGYPAPNNIGLTNAVHLVLRP